MTNNNPRAIAFCPHCGNTAPQRQVGVHSRLRGPNEAQYYTLVSCETCDRGLLYLSGLPDAPAHQLINAPFSLEGRELVWPQGNELHEAVPDPVRVCYNEACAVKRVAPNAFANQVRRSLEALCRDRGAQGRVLAQSLKELADRGEIPPVLAEMTDILRFLGNIGSHAAEEQVEPEYVDAIDDFFKAVVEYVAPYRVKEVKAELDHAKALRH